MYEMLEPNIRIAVRALITRDQSVLVQHKVYEDGTERYVLPGGAPEVGETLEQGLIRECREEIGTDVQVRKLLHIAELFKPRSLDPTTTRHQLEMIFSCNVSKAYTPGNGLRPDKHQVDVVWLEKSAIGVNFWPRGLTSIVEQKDSFKDQVYLGLIN